MAFIYDTALDAFLASVAAADTIHLCTSEPANFAAVAGASLGSTGVTFGAAEDNPGAGGGRRRSVTPDTGDTYGSSGTVSHFALIVGTTLVVTKNTTTTKAVNSGDAIAFTGPFYINSTDAT